MLSPMGNRGLGALSDVLFKGSMRAQVLASCRAGKALIPMISQGIKDCPIYKDDDASPPPCRTNAQARPAGDWPERVACA